MNITTEDLISRLSEELYGYEVHVKDIYVEITKTILKVDNPTIVDAGVIDKSEVKENFDMPMKPNIREYRFCKCITFFELQRLYEHNGFKGLREEFEGMIKYYMDGE